MGIKIWMLKNGVFDMNRANDLARLCEEMETGHRDRVEFVADITNRVAELRKENQADNKERAANEVMRKREGEQESKVRVEFVADITNRVAELRKENQAENKERAANEVMRKREGEQESKVRAEFVADMKRGVAELRKEIQADNKELFIGVAEQRKENQAQNTAAHVAWFGTGATRANQVAARAEDGAFGMEGKLIEKLGFGTRETEEPVARPETEAKSQPSTHESEMSDEERVLQVVRENPSGISATQIGEQVSLYAMAVGKIMKGLIEKGKAQRDDETRLYTPSKGGE
ncbi:hypothetical protein [Marinobacter gelidimuriae]|uniref:hypothetical protein n=1 Tax=Marinobacter gelidimuriae TaxID=2739064 RepID=UPI00035FED89|nr:hypothetical protein [Marinobacter gelidimuriae]